MTIAVTVMPYTDNTQLKGPQNEYFVAVSTIYDHMSSYALHGSCRHVRRGSRADIGPLASTNLATIQATGYSFKETREHPTYSILSNLQMLKCLIPRSRSAQLDLGLWQ